MTVIVFAVLALLARQETATLRGVVTDEVTKEPIAGASVILVRPEAIADAVVVSTDARGQFVFENVRPAMYRLLAEHDAYVRSNVDLTVDLLADRPASRLTSLTLLPSAVISGRVTDEYGEPAGRVYVRALVAGVVAEARTNDLGEYRLFGLRPGAYIISAERYQGPSIQGAVVNTPTPPCPDCPGEGAGRMPLAGLLASGAFIDPRALTGQTYPAVFFPGTTDRSAAGSVKVIAGAQVDGIDLRLVVR
jgi:carboxypeptidase family protein